MFIKTDSLVEVVAGKHAGRTGRVDRIVIEADTGLALLMVSVFNCDDGTFYSLPFDAAELRLKKSNYDDLAAFMLMEDAVNVSEKRRAA